MGRVKSVLAYIVVGRRYRMTVGDTETRVLKNVGRQFVSSGRRNSTGITLARISSLLIGYPQCICFALARYPRRFSVEANSRTITSIKLDVDALSTKIAL